MPAALAGRARPSSGPARTRYAGSPASRRASSLPAPGYDHLVDPARCEFAGQQPDLALAAAPLASGGDVDDRARVTPPAPTRGEQGAELGEAERLVQVGTVEGLEEREGVSPDGVARC